MIGSIEDLIDQPEIAPRITETLQEAIVEGYADLAIVATPLSNRTDYLVWAVSIQDRALEMVTDPLPASLFCLEMMATGMPIRIDDIRTLPEEQACNFMTAEELHGFLGAPVAIRNGEPDAIVALLSRGPKYWSPQSEAALAEATQTVKSILNDAFNDYVGHLH